MLPSSPVSDIVGYPSPTDCCLQHTRQPFLLLPDSSNTLFPPEVPSLEAREEAYTRLSYKSTFISPDAQTEEDQLFSRFIELYWDRISTSAFGQQQTLEQDLESLRLQCEKEMQGLGQKTKNNLLLKLVQGCGPLFLKSLDDPVLKHKAALSILAQAAKTEAAMRKYLEALKTVDEQEAGELLAVLEKWIPFYLDKNLDFCRYILNTLEDKPLVKRLVLRCFEKALYIEKYESLIAMLEDPGLKNDICFELLALPQFSHNARKAFLAYIQPQNHEDTVRKDSCIEGWMFRQMHLFERILQDFLPSIQEESLKACLFIKFLSKRSLTATTHELIKHEIQTPCLRYWICLVLDAASLQEAKALLSLQETLGVNLRDPFPKIKDYSQAKAFITRFLRYAVELEPKNIQAAFRAVLGSLEKATQENILQGICLDADLYYPLRELVAKQIEDPTLRERYLKDIQENTDRTRVSALKLACPKV